MAVVVLVIAAAGISCRIFAPADPEEAARESVSDLRERIARVVPDADRVAELNEMVNSLEREVDGLLDAIGSYRDRLREMNRDHTATRRSFEQLFSEFDRSRKAKRGRLVALHSRMKEWTTPEEWSEIFEAERNALGALLRRSGNQGL